MYDVSWEAWSYIHLFVKEGIRNLPFFTEKRKMKLSIIIPLYNQENLILKAINSISPRDDVEIIVIDDCSTDKSYEEVQEYIKFSDQNIVLLHNIENKGVAYTVNKGYDYSKGEYVVLLGSDDYFHTNELNYCIDNDLDGTDIVYFNIDINNGEIFKLSQETKRLYCGSTKFMRKDFIGETRNPLIEYCEDLHFYNELLEKNPTEKFTDRLVKHYNFPRVGSLSYKARNEIR